MLVVSCMCNILHPTTIRFVELIRSPLGDIQSVSYSTLAYTTKAWQPMCTQKTSITQHSLHYVGDKLVEVFDVGRAMGFSFLSFNELFVGQYYNHVWRVTFCPTFPQPILVQLGIIITCYSRSTLSHVYPFGEPYSTFIFQPITLSIIGSIHDWGTAFGIKEPRTMLHWISTFYYDLLLFNS